jgi:hypothetical protein
MWRGKHTCSFEVPLMGGLGNQLFQVAHALSLALSLGRPVAFSSESFVHDQKRNSHLEILGIKPSVYYRIEIIDGSIRLNADSSIRCNCNSVSIFENQFEYKDLEVPRSRFQITGYWQSDLYFNSFKKEIRSYFQSRLRGVAIKNYEVSIHIRLGDMLSEAEVSRKHGILTVSYFKKALSLLPFSTEVSVLSDSPGLASSMYLPYLRDEFSNSHFSLNLNSSLEEDFQVLMSSQNIVTGNSTFSWWGAYLSDAKNVIAPRMLFNKNALRENNICDFYPAGWTLV